MRLSEIIKSLRLASLGDKSGATIAGVTALVAEAFQFFCLDTFGKNGCRLFVRPSVDITMYGAAIFIQRTFKP